MKLDRARSFGVVSGWHHGAVTYQDGRYFDADDEYVETDVDQAPAADEPPQGEVDAALPAGLTKEQVLSQLTVAQLKVLMTRAGGEPVIGIGAKQKMIAWLVDNTQ